ncbi:MAG: amino acid-binding protein [Rhodospirillaceae bacterium]|jgi:glycine cleavage system transcriptional repressor|nr:amino acid-binding protein [Rhodospirillaceae bacterium]MBT5245856.1 amino acid-binding protein [Rhodospirillaceae bacterium]MBT5561254.1 amino acid-binding protein [Rhodospirillaceae bacterium]MBT6240501.1 amino acid-binding protein [Rhodospirillaceae bacterium]MBT7136339.1 amino acid-binding protein [Rhodospirillaceae bacterium]
MPTIVLVSIICPDRIGLVSAISGLLYDQGVNLDDTTFAVLGGGAEFTAVCELPESLELDELKKELSGLEELHDAEITVTNFALSPIHAETAHITHRIVMQGGDRPGLIARLCEVFGQFNANIVRLNSDKMPGPGNDQYEIRIAVWIPEESVKSCLAIVANTAGELRMKCRWHEVDDRPV